ncbi:MAG: hypothetical protein WC889_06380 [Myxococcota bacterium]
MAGQEAPKARYRRKQLLVDRGFQLKYTIIIAIIGMLIAGLWGTLFYKASREHSEQFMLSLKIDPQYQGIADKIDERLPTEDVKILYLLTAFILLIGGSLVGWGVVVTHRVAGPIFIISRYVNQIAGGKYPDPRPLRKKDELKDFFTQFNLMLTALKERERSDVKALEGAVVAMKKAQAGNVGDLAGMTVELDELLKAKIAMLDDKK